MRFYLTTAIDYVNSRPHLGTAYEKITADVIARYKRLAGFDDPIPDGQRRALAERVPPRAGAGQDSAGVLRPDGAGVPRGLARARHLVRRLHPHDRAARTSRPCSAMVAALPEAGDIYEGVYEGWYCVGCEAFKQEKDLVDGNVPDPPDQRPSGSARRTSSSACRSTSSRCSTTTPPTRSSSSPRCGATRSCGCVEAGSRTSR